MPCDLDTLQIDACTSGIGRETDPIALLQVIAQLACEQAGAECDLAVIQDAGCETGILRETDRLSLLQLIAQLTCEISEGDCDVDTILEDACTSGLLKEQSYVELLQVIAQLLCGDVAPPPDAPSDLQAAAVSSSQIDLQWVDNASDETGFRIERKTGIGGTYAEIDTVAAGVTTYQDTGLTPETEYYYRVRAFNAAGNSPYSNEANATTLEASRFLAYALISKNADQPTATTIPEEVTWEDVLFDTASLRSGNTFVIPAQFNGKHAQLFAGVRWSSDAGTTRRSTIPLKNGADFIGAASEELGSPITTARAGQQLMTPPVAIATGDVFSLESAQFSGVDLDVQDNGNSYFGIIIVDSFQGAMVTLGAPLTIPFNTFTYIALDTETVDTGGFWDAGAPSRLTIPAGVSRVRLYAGTKWDADAGGRSINIDRNGAGSFAGGTYCEFGTPAAADLGEAFLNVTTPILNVSAGQFFEVQTIQKIAAGGLDILPVGASYFAIQVID